MKLVELPMGLGMALAQNETAMKNFEAMNDAQKQDIIEKTHHVESKKEMRALVSSIANGTCTLC